MTTLPQNNTSVKMLDQDCGKKKRTEGIGVDYPDKNKQALFINVKGN